MEAVIFLLVAICAAVRGENILEEDCDQNDSLFTPTEVNNIVKIHNDYRSSQNGTNELDMEWNELLAKKAQRRADSCEWAHGDLKSCEGYTLGQNLYMSIGSQSTPDVNVPNALKAWFDEITDYNQVDGSCAEGKVCGHYTAMVWYKSKAVGCGYQKCATASFGETTINNVMIVACDYFPAGNIQGVVPIQPGLPCASCNSVIHDKGYACHQGLCDECTPKSDARCICLFNTCENGGTFIADDCACQCTSGYGGSQCQFSCDRSVACQDGPYSASCETSWIDFCVNAQYKNFMTKECSGTCTNLCKVPDSCP